MNEPLADTADADVFSDDNDDVSVTYAASERGVAADLAKVRAYKILRVMPFGDSITYGVIGSDDTESGGYRKVLADRLAA